MRGWNRAHLWVGVAIVLVIVLGGCCVLSVFGPNVRGRVDLPGGWGPLPPPWTLMGFFGWVFGLFGLIVYTAIVVALTLLAVGKLPRIWQRGAHR